MKKVLLTVVTSVSLIGCGSSSKDENSSQIKNANNSLCLSNICVGDKVIPYDFNRKDATVVAINKSNNTIMVKSPSSYIYKYLPSQLGLTKGCLSNICVGDKVFPYDFTSKNATVVAINKSNNTIMVRSPSSYIYKYLPSQLGLTKGCLSNICVGDIVFPHDFTSKNATVVAINKSNNTIMVRSPSSEVFKYLPNELSIVE